MNKQRQGLYSPFTPGGAYNSPFSRAGTPSYRNTGTHSGLASRRSIAGGYGTKSTLSEPRPRYGGGRAPTSSFAQSPELYGEDDAPPISDLDDEPEFSLGSDRGYSSAATSPSSLGGGIGTIFGESDREGVHSRSLFDTPSVYGGSTGPSPGTPLSSHYTPRARSPSSSILSGTPQSASLRPSPSPGVFSARSAASSSSNWVTVYGFPPEHRDYVLMQFDQCGDIEEYETEEKGNWVHIRYRNNLDCSAALSKNGQRLDDLMIGVVSRVLEEKSHTPAVKRESFAGQGRSKGRVLQESQATRQVSWWSKFLEYVFGL